MHHRHALLKHHPHLQPLLKALPLLIALPLVKLFVIYAFQLLLAAGLDLKNLPQRIPVHLLHL